MRLEGEQLAAIKGAKQSEGKSIIGSRTSGDKRLALLRAATEAITLGSSTLDSACG
jgi:hypothetical protein